MSQSTIVVAEGTAETPAAAPAAAEGQAPAGGETGHTAEGTGAEGGHGGFPPMNAQSFPSQIFWLVIFFALLYLLMSKVALPRMSAVLKKRADAIRADLARANALKDETEAAVQSWEKSLADARAKAQDISTETRIKLVREMEDERSALDQTLTAKISEAEARVAKAKAKALHDVDEIAAETAAEIVSALTGSATTKDAAAKAVAGLKA